MRPVVVLGGYGRLGRSCVQEILSRTRSAVVIAGRNAQRAESLALALGERASARYADATEPRALTRALEGAAAVVACCGGDLLVALQTALEVRAPLIGVSPLALELRSQMRVAERAWQAQVPIVVHAGAVPGIPGLLAESLVRRLPSIDRLEIAATGPFVGSECAARDQERARDRASLDGGLRALRLPELWSFPEPVGRAAVAPAATADLAGFAERHCVRSLRYLEESPGALGRALARVMGRGARKGFAVAARAFGAGDVDEPKAQIELVAADALAPAAALVGALTAAVVDGRVPAGLSLAREALSPAVALGELEKRGAKISLRVRA
jgi:putative NAD(P)-binding protein